jgi:hypothetical protein
MKKLLLSIAVLALVIPAQAQTVNLLEFEDFIIVPPQGPNANPVTVPFSLDAVNDNVFAVPTQPLSAELSLTNQQFTGLTYSNVSTGIVFGAYPTLSTSFTGSTTQEAEPFVPYALMGYYVVPGGGPKNFMFTSDPYATPAQLGTGHDVEGEGNAGFTGGVELFTAAQVLYDNATPINSRVYFGDLVITFSEPVKDPVVHLAGLGGSYSYLPIGATNIASNYRRTYFTTELEMINTGLSSTVLSSNPLLTMVGNNVHNFYSRPNGNSDSVVGEFPLNNYGAATGSVRINGTVQTLKYRVYLKGSPLSTTGQNWSGEGIDALGNQVVTGATRDPFSGDAWLVSLSLRAPYQRVTGNVFVDADGLTMPDNDITTTAGLPNDKTNGGGTLYANLLDNTGNVVATTPVSSDGVYLFDSVAPATYTVQLTNTPGTVGSLAPTTALPTGWVNTGEKNGLTPGGDGAINGNSAPISVTSGNSVTQVNFGIEREPNSDPKVQTIPFPVGGVIAQGVATTPISGTDPEQGALTPADTIRITGLPTNATVFYNGIPMFAGQSIGNFNPALLSYTGITVGSSNVVFTYAFVDDAKVVDPTPATYELNWFQLQAESVTLGGVVAASSNDLSVRLNLAQEAETVVLYRQVNNNTEEALTDLPTTQATSEYKDYGVEDNNVYKYYVLATTKNGTNLKSQVVVLNRVGENEVIVYPNPATTTITTQFSEVLTADASVNIYNAEGRLVNRFTIPAGTNSEQVDISRFAAGKYVIQISHNDKVKVVKFIKQ